MRRVRELRRLALPVSFFPERWVRGNWGAGDWAPAPFAAGRKPQMDPARPAPQSMESNRRDAMHAERIHQAGDRPRNTPNTRKANREGICSSAYPYSAVNPFCSRLRLGRSASIASLRFSRAKPLEIVILSGWSPAEKVPKPSKGLASCCAGPLVAKRLECGVFRRFDLGLFDGLPQGLTGA